MHHPPELICCYLLICIFSLPDINSGILNKDWTTFIINYLASESFPLRYITGSGKQNCRMSFKIAFPGQSVIF